MRKKKNTRRLIMSALSKGLAALGFAAMIAFILLSVWAGQLLDDVPASGAVAAAIEQRDVQATLPYFILIAAVCGAASLLIARRPPKRKTPASKNSPRRESRSVPSGSLAVVSRARH